MKPVRGRVSRKPIAVVVALCLALSAVLIPVALRLPKIAEAEIVVGAWWAVWIGVLTFLLFRGDPVDDDADWIGQGTDRIKGWWDWAGLPWDLGCWFDEGCATVVLAIFVLLFLGLAFILLIEFVIPAIAILLFLSIGGMVARAVNDNHHCEGRFGLSLIWGAIWATVYVGPVAAVVIWVVSLVGKG
jgi:hypothetical protein